MTAPYHQAQGLKEQVRPFGETQSISEVLRAERAGVNSAFTSTFVDEELFRAYMDVPCICEAEVYDHPVKREFLWAIHNLIAHPLSEVTYWLGYLLLPIRDFGNWFHDITVPRHAPNTGRG